MVYTHRRKLVKQGTSTITVSLPPDWVRGHALNPGDEVWLNSAQGRLFIEAEPADDNEQRIGLDVRKLSERMLGLLLNTLHKKGLDEIRLTIEPKQLPYIQQRIAKNLLGYEIVEQKKDVITIRTVTRTDPEEFEQVLRRAWLVTLNMAEGVTDPDTDPESLLALEETNNRLTNYCERILVRSQMSKPNIIFTYIIVWLLEKVADEYRDIIVEGRSKDGGAESAAELLRAYYELFYKYSYEQHDNVIHETQRLSHELTQADSAYARIPIIMQQSVGSLIAMNSLTDD